MISGRDQRSAVGEAGEGMLVEGRQRRQRADGELVVLHLGAGTARVPQQLGRIAFRFGGRKAGQGGVDAPQGFAHRGAVGRGEVAGVHLPIGHQGEDGPQATAHAKKGLGSGTGDRGGHGNAILGDEVDDAVLARHELRLGVAVALEEVGTSGGGGDQVLVQQPTRGGLDAQGTTEAVAPQQLVRHPHRGRRQDLAVGHERRVAPPEHQAAGVTTTTPSMFTWRSQTYE
jgi:hypothetical protein